MPWQKSALVDLRKEFVTLAVSDDVNVSELCRRFGIARKTGYKWIKRYQIFGHEALTDASRRPYHSPTQTSENIRNLIYDLHEKNPSWGGRKISSAIKAIGKLQGIAPSTVTRLLNQHKEQSSFEADGHLVSPNMECGGAESSVPNGYRAVNARRVWLEFVARVEGKPVESYKTDDHRFLMNLIREPANARNRIKGIAVLAHYEGISNSAISRNLGIGRNSCAQYIKKYLADGIKGLIYRKAKSVRSDNALLKETIFSVLHTPPLAHGINRTTWKLDDLRKILKEEENLLAGNDIIRSIIHRAGYRWKKARIVLTSNDPEYNKKISKIQEILATLGEDERFFSIDEYGPFAVRMRGGYALRAPGADYTVPQWQKSKGSLIVTAALELSRNQVTHFYSSRKDTVEMIRLINSILKQYNDVKKIYLSWDAASWHVSKKLYQFIDEYNAKVDSDLKPFLILAPLPARAQFLNVIEAVFSGMSRAIIQNSNYETIDDAMRSIDLYFKERNLHFALNPKRAGKKIWRSEQCVTDFNLANNCKSALYR